MKYLSSNTLNVQSEYRKNSQKRKVCYAGLGGVGNLNPKKRLYETHNCMPKHDTKRCRSTFHTDFSMPHSVLPKLILARIGRPRSTKFSGVCVRVIWKGLFAELVHPHISAAGTEELVSYWCPRRRRNIYWDKTFSLSLFLRIKDSNVAKHSRAEINQMSNSGQKNEFPLPQ